MLAALDRVLGHYQLSAPTGIEIGPGETAQPLHPDDAIYPLARPHDEIVVNAMWPLCDFTAENGGTVLLPGSHRWANEFPTDDTPTITIEMPAGSLLLYSRQPVARRRREPHRSTAPRRRAALRARHGCGRSRTTCSSVPRDVVRTLPERLQELLGYNIRPPFIGYVDGRHPRKLLER